MRKRFDPPPPDDWGGMPVRRPDDGPRRTPRDEAAVQVAMLAAAVVAVSFGLGSLLAHALR